MEPAAVARRRGRPPGASLKSAQTREHIYSAALALLAARGFHRTSMRDVAADAGVSLGLAYRYFSSKDEIALELYKRQAEQLLAAVSRIPSGTVGERFEAAVESKLSILAPYRRTLAALFAVGLDPESPAYVFGSTTESVRGKVTEAMRHVVTGAGRKLSTRIAAPLSELLFVLQLGIVFFWLHDRTEHQRATRKLLATARRSIDLSVKLLRLPGVSSLLVELVSSLRPIFGVTREKAGFVPGAEQEAP